MLDQATRLREMAAAYRAQATGTQPRRMHAIAVTSGKGGVGKTNVSINLAHAILAAGKDVLLMDVDLGMANADILLGTVPPYHLGHFLRGEKDILQVIHKTPNKLKLIAGGSGFVELGNLSADRLQPVLRNLKRLEQEADYLILDTGAGLGDSVLEFVLAADQVVVVTTPEPTALADAYTMIKAMYYRNAKIDVKLVVNQAERPEEGAAVAERIGTTARDFLGLRVEHVGTIPRDPYVWQAVRTKVPFILGYPNAPASKAVHSIAQRLLNVGGGQGGGEPKSAIGSFFDRLGSLFGRKNSSAM